MIAGLENFTPKDYEKVMAAVTKAHIELVDKLAKEDLEVAKAQPVSAKAAAKPATKAAPQRQRSSAVLWKAAMVPMMRILSTK